MVQVLRVWDCIILTAATAETAAALIPRSYKTSRPATHRHASDEQRRAGSPHRPSPFSPAHRSASDNPTHTPTHRDHAPLGQEPHSRHGLDPRFTTSEPGHRTEHVDDASLVYNQAPSGVQVLAPDEVRRHRALGCQ